MVLSVKFTLLVTHIFVIPGALDFEHIEEQAEGIFGGRYSQSDAETFTKYTKDDAFSSECVFCVCLVKRTPHWT